jgi:hypothetical protein
MSALLAGFSAEEFAQLPYVSRPVGTRRGVFCVPVVPNFQSTFQWLRELRGRGYSRLRGIKFRIDDGESIFVGNGHRK